MTTKESMHIDPYERAWIIVSIVLILIFAIAVGMAGFALGFQVPSPMSNVLIHELSQRIQIHPGLTQACVSCH